MADQFLQSPIGGKVGLDVNIASGSPIPVFIVTPPSGTTPQEILPTYGAITNVASSVESTVASYTVPIGKDFYLVRTLISGTNIALYRLKVNGTTISTRRTWFADRLSDQVETSGQPNTGVHIVQGDVVSITVEHTRPTLGDFEATILGLLIG